MATIGERIVAKALETLDETPEGVRYSDLVRPVIEFDGSFKTNTVHGNVWNLDERFPIRYTSRRTVSFRLTKYRTDTDQLKEELVPKQPRIFKEGLLRAVCRLVGERDGGMYQGRRTRWQPLPR